MSVESIPVDEKSVQPLVDCSRNDRPALPNCTRESHSGLPGQSPIPADVEAGDFQVQCSVNKNQNANRGDSGIGTSGEEGGGVYYNDDEQAEPEPEKGKKGLKKSKFDGWESIKARNQFIFRVFMIVWFLLIYNFAIMCLFMFIPVIRNFTRHNWWLMLVFGLCYLPFGIVLGCCVSVARKKPVNFILLFFASTFMGGLLGCLSAFYEIDEVLLAVGVTIAIVFILALFAAFAPCDFTMCIGVAFVLSLVLCAFGIFMIFFNDRIVYMIYCSLGILLACLLIVIDIQMICGGRNRRYKFSEED